MLMVYYKTNEYKSKNKNTAHFNHLKGQSLVSPGRRL